nr:magnesium transporter MRS2-I-like [Ipomoea batatas]
MGFRSGARACNYSCGDIGKGSELGGVPCAQEMEAALFLRDPLDETVAPVVEELRRRLKPVNCNHGDQAEGKGEVEESPFEVKALEVALEAVCSYLDAQTSDLEAAVYPALDLLTSKISSQNLDRVRKLKSQMTRLTARVQKVRDEIEKLLDDDDDMADLYLSRKSGRGGASSSPVSSSFLSSPTDGSKRCRASSASMATFHGDDENNVLELEMLLEFGYVVEQVYSVKTVHTNVDGKPFDPSGTTGIGSFEKRSKEIVEVLILGPLGLAVPEVQG